MAEISLLCLSFFKYIFAYREQKELQNLFKIHQFQMTESALVAICISDNSLLPL